MPRANKDSALGHTSNDTNRYRNLPKPDLQAASWKDCNPEQLGYAVISVAQAGDAILIAATSDGGALKLLILAGTEKIPHYCPRADDVDAVTDALQKIDE